MRGERYRITLKANDPEGVQSILLNPTLGSGEMVWQCLDPPGGQAGWSFASGSAKLTGRARNYFGGTTTEVIKFNVAP